MKRNVIIMMSRKSRFFRFLFYFVCLNFVFAINASAYIDPATTSYVVQIVAGIVIAAGTAVGIFWNKIKRKMKKTDKTPDPEIRQENRGGVMTAQDLMSDDDDNE